MKMPSAAARMAREMAFQSVWFSARNAFPRLLSMNVRGIAERGPRPQLFRLEAFSHAIVRAPGARPSEP
jgi:hypothetical protein